MSTTPIETWAVDLADVTLIYPWVGSERVMVFLAVVLWIGWHVWQYRHEEKEFENIYEAGLVSYELGYDHSIFSHRAEMTYFRTSSASINEATQRVGEAELLPGDTATEPGIERDERQILDPPRIDDRSIMDNRNKPAEKRELNAWISDASPRVGMEFRVSMNIGRRADSAVASKEFTEPDWENRDSVDLLVKLSGLSFSARPSSRRLTLPRVGDTETIDFAVVAKDEGAHPLSIRVYLAKQLVLIQSLSFIVEVTGEEVAISA